MIKLPNIDTYLTDLENKTEKYWQTKGEHRVLQLFHEMATRVPAYKDFLQKSHVDHNKIKTIQDFSSIPPIDKDNYLRFYPRKALCWDGNFSDIQWVFSTTSGSTGEPFYFPRTAEQDMQYALTAEAYLRSNFLIDKKSTLYIIGFPMGAWIGGVFTYQALQYIQQTGKYALSIISPGINKKEIIKAVINLGKDFDQIIIGSYGPFLKDTIDDGIRLGVNWKDYQLGFIFSAEGFTETFRNTIAEKTGLKDVFHTTLNHYGTVDFGTMAHETPLSILLRRLALANKDVYALVFGDTTKLPTLTQYNPQHFYFESDNGNLYCSSYSGIPLVRYDLKDRGSVLPFDETLSRLQQLGLNLHVEANNVGIKQIWHFPFIYVYERSDFSVSFFAFQIYPETIRKALQANDLEKEITGKFTMLVKFDKASNQYLEINVELKHGRKKSQALMKSVQHKIVKQLLEENSEYRKTYESYPKQTIPKIILWPYEHNTHFQPGIKQKWTKKHE